MNTKMGSCGCNKMGWKRNYVQ